MKKTLVLIPILALLAFPFAVHSESYPDGCTATTKYSATTGQPCQKPACSPGDLFNYNTGQKCEGDVSNLPEGCVTTAGFSHLTGKKCDGTVRTWNATSTVPVTTNVVTSTPVVQQNASIKLKTKDLGSRYEFDAYLYDSNGKNITFSEPQYLNSKVVFSLQNTITNARRSDMGFDPSSNQYYFKYSVDKNTVTSNTITVSFAELGISQSFTIADTI